MTWKTKVVTYEWFEQSCERGLILEEECFHPTMAIEDRGRGAWDRERKSPSKILGKRTRQPDQASRGIDPLKRKLRRSASSKMGIQSEALWAGITAVSMERKPNEEDDWTEDVKNKSAIPKSSKPVTLASKTTVTAGQGDVLPRDTASHAGSLEFAHGKDGIFQGRVVFPHGFDSEKVIDLLLVHVLDLH